MSAEVETMFYAGEVPWHGFGVYVGDENLDSKTAIIKARLDWDVELRDIIFKDGRDQTLYNNIPDHKAVVRLTDEKVLGVVGNKFVPAQNIEAFEFMDSLVNTNQMKFHTAGSLRGGKNIWLLGKVGQTEVLPNDLVDHYLMLYNSHDGTGALRCFFTAVRVVCANTAAMALGEAKGQGVKLRHTSQIDNHLTAAQAVLGLGQQEFNQFGDFAQRLVRKDLTTEEWKEFALTVFPDPPEGKRLFHAEGKREVLTDLFENGTGQDIKGVSGTAWAAYNAIVEFSNYYKPTRGDDAQEKRFMSSTLMTKTSLISLATEELIKIAA